MKSYEPKNICLILANGEKHPVKITLNLNKNHTFRFSESENRTLEVSSSYLKYCGILYFLPEDSSRMRVYLLICFFVFVSFLGVIISTQ